MMYFQLILLRKIFKQKAIIVILLKKQLEFILFEETELLIKEFMFLSI